MRAARKELGCSPPSRSSTPATWARTTCWAAWTRTPTIRWSPARAKEEGAQAIPICAKTEEDIAGSTQEEKMAFLQEMGIESTGLDNLIKASYDLLGLICFLTDGKKNAAPGPSSAAPRPPGRR